MFLFCRSEAPSSLSFRPYHPVFQHTYFLGIPPRSPVLIRTAHPFSASVSRFGWPDFTVVLLNCNTYGYTKIRPPFLDIVKLMLIVEMGEFWVPLG
jgi:hypothetical protein